VPVAARWVGIYLRYLPAEPASQVAGRLAAISTPPLAAGIAALPPSASLDDPVDITSLDTSVISEDDTDAQVAVSAGVPGTADETIITNWTVRLTAGAGGWTVASADPAR